METKTLTGSCLCGSVRYTVQGEPQRAFHCHCSRCRKATGTGHASNLFVAGTLTWDAGEALVDTAHQVCPYSNATRGNLPMTLTLG